MENIAKALLMAGAVMIGVFLLYNFTQSMDTTSQFTVSYSDKMERDRVAQYNSDFTQYTGMKINMYEVASLLNKVLYINETTNFDTTTYNYITVTLENIDFKKENSTKSDSNDFIAEFVTDGQFDYDSYNEAVFGMLADYYDNTIDWRNQPVLNPKREKIPAFYLVITNYEEGLVSDITFTRNGVFEPEEIEENGGI